MIALTDSSDEIGSDTWKKADEKERRSSLEPLLETCSKTAMRTSGVPQMLRNYLRKFAPLERVEVTRGHEWRGGRYAGSLASKFSDLFRKDYEPVALDSNLCIHDNIH